MIEKKMFGLSLPTDAILLNIRHDLKEINPNIRLSFVMEGGHINRIPRGFDAYYLHLTYANMRDLENLRAEQPWSWIYGWTGAGTNNIVPEVKKCLDRMPDIVTMEEDTKAIAQDLTKYREVPTEVPA